MRRPRLLKSVLTDVAASLGIDDPLEGRLLANWAAAAGSDVAAVCGPEKLTGGRLTVSVDNPVLRYEMSMRRDSLRERLNDWLGEERIKEVQVKLRRIRGS